MRNIQVKYHKRRDIFPHLHFFLLANALPFIHMLFMQMLIAHQIQIKLTDRRMKHSQEGKYNCVSRPLLLRKKCSLLTLYFHALQGQFHSFSF